MIKKFLGIFLVCVFLAMPVQAADLCYSTTETSQLIEDTSYTLQVPYRAGETFVASGDILNSITVKLRNNNTGQLTAICTTSLYLTANNVPTGTPIIESAQNVPYVDGTTFNSFTFNFDQTITSGTQYAWVVSCSPGPNSMRRASSDIWAEGTPFISTNSGTTWSVSNVNDFYFIVNETSEVPCPAKVEILSTSTPALDWFSNQYLFPFEIIVGAMLALALFRLLRDTTLTIWAWWRKL